MESFLRRLQHLPAILNRKQYKRWLRQQYRHVHSSTQIYGRTFQSTAASFRNRMEDQVVWQNDQQYSGFSQAPRKFNSTDTKSRLRNWEPVEKDFTAKEHGLPIRIVSYNILAQSLLVGHLDLYRLCNQVHLKWDYRLAKLSEEILAQKPDILCMQEVQENHLGDILSHITAKLPMNCLFKKKTGFREDGCAIFYNKDIFEIITSELVEYFQPGIDLLDRHNIALIAKLRCKDQPKVTFLVCTTHMLYNPKRQDVRLCQLMVLLAELDRHSVVGCPEQRIPIILTGDFNFKPDSAPFQLICDGELHYEYLARKTLTEADSGVPATGKNFVPATLGITDSCQHIDCVNSNYKDTSCRLHSTSHAWGDTAKKPAVESDPELFSTGTLSHGLDLKSMYDHSGDETYGSTFQNEWITVDHMFYSQPEETHPKQGSLQLLSVYKLPTATQCKQIGPLPNADFGSDHLMLASNLFLSFPDES